ncbi:MAG: PTS sugar transporter subunit IIA [Ruminococcus sp.]|uniref:PTS fructose transporter subunit IIABC n=1 Tax=Ruminococcus sp. TaxID=41978 RepID=UPI002873F0CF|nr:fructose-specific PTS transporter subunit EIIC [Ruminococcus sp.]MBQ3286073.1 PTS sugar transporter subunit IIA [Ruminococcus sp.]
MRITDLLKLQAIQVNAKVSTKSEAIDALVALHDKCGNLKDVAAYKAGILKREEEGTTAIGMEVAIPHAKSPAVKAPALAAITVANGVDYGSPEGDMSKLIFMIAATMDGDVHLDVLARLMQMLMHEDFTDKLKAAKTPQEFLDIIDAQETAQFPDEVSDAAPAAKKDGYQVLAVTACPTGIAHTYMAAEALQKAGDKLGITIKVETNGSGGAKNVLTAEEIANCDGIIIAADKNVDTARFSGKPVYSTKVADGIHKPEELINKIVNKEVPVFYSDKKATASTASAGNESFGRQLYKHLMNGVSHMLPFVVAGGIFIAIAFLIDTICGFGNIANSPELLAQGYSAGDFGSITPAAAFFKTIGGVAFNLMVPILAGFIAMSIADRPGLLVGLVGGFLATSGATFVLPGGDVPSGFLGGLLAGFIGGYMMLGIEKLCSHFPRALEGIKPVLVYPLLGLGGIAVIMCAINPIMGWINTGMNNVLIAMSEKEGLMIPLCALLAGMMAIDMGGPFNKAAYVFATGMLSFQTDAAYMIMAAVMIGGMVPPIAIALSTNIFRNKWTAEERKNAPVNYIMGLSFITEGAIPYAAGHPWPVIPCCIVGSATAGALSALFGCKLMAPHGGVFVFATMAGTWYLYLLALVIGAVLGAILLGLLMKKPQEA